MFLVIMKHGLYILYSPKIDKYYIGISHDPAERLQWHNRGLKGWTRRGIPWKLVFVQFFPEKEIAAKYERWLKKQKSRRLIEQIISGEILLKNIKL